jgi:hypothetical protein
MLQTFSGDAVRLAQIMISVQNDITAAEDPRTPYLVEGQSANDIVMAAPRADPQRGHA